MTADPPTVFGALSNRDLACMYRALCVYIGAPDSGAWLSMPAQDDAADRAPGTGPTPDEAGENSAQKRALFRLGYEAQREIDSRGREAILALAPELVGWPFATWETFCEAVRRAAIGTMNP